MSPSIRLATAAALVVLAAALTAPAAGQAPDDTLRSVVMRAEAGDWHVRLSTPGGAYDGRVTHVKPDTVLLVGARIPLADVTAVERQVREGGGGVVGALVGALAVGGLGLAASGACETGCTGSGILYGGGGALAGGLVGALVGTAIAPPRERWEPLWPVPQR